MTIDKIEEGKSVTIKLTGRLNTTTAPEFENQIEGLAKDSDVIVDMKELEYISSAGLRVLLKLQRMVEDEGFLKLTNVTKDVMEILEITGFSDILTID